MISFRLFGYPVRIQWFFWLLCLLLGAGYLEIGGSKGFTLFLISTSVIFLSILLHEFGHAWARKLFREPYSEITLHGFGGYCSGPGHFTRQESIFISAAGPLVNVALALIAFLAPLLFQGMETNLYFSFFFSYLLFLNIALTILNILPIYPLDGGQIFAAAVANRNPRLVYWVGLILAAALAVGSFVQTQQFFMAIIFGMLAYDNWQLLQTRRSSFH